MAKATKTTTRTAQAKTADAATKTTVRPGSTPAKEAATKATAQGGADYDAKANAVRDAAKAKSTDTKEVRFVVAQGKSLRSRGVRYMGGEAVDLPEADGQRLIAEGVLIADDKGVSARDAGGVPATVQDGDAPLAPGDAAPPVGDAGTTPAAGATPPADGDNAGDK